VGFDRLVRLLTLQSVGDGRTVGVFAAQGIQNKRSELAQYSPIVPADRHTPGVAYLTFTVACYDSLARQMRRPPF
jgi:hypothetical protein